MALWLLGYPDLAVADIVHVLKAAREIGHAGTLIYALSVTSYTHLHCGNYAATSAQANELIALADEKGTLFWKAFGMIYKGCALTTVGKNSNAVQMIASGIIACRSTGATQSLPSYMSHLAKANAELGQLNDAWRCINEAMTTMETTKETWYEAEVRRTAGEISLMLSEPDAMKAEAHFERALAVAHKQQAKSWELRVAMSMARLWRDQGKRQQAHDLLSSVYGWFTEGFDTLDLKEAKALLEQLRA
jgi:predicted ATPase